MQPGWRLHLPRFPRKENVNEVKLCRVKITGGSRVPWSSYSRELLPPVCLRSKERELLTEPKEDLQRVVEVHPRGAVIFSMGVQLLPTGD